MLDLLCEVFDLKNLQDQPSALRGQCITPSLKAEEVRPGGEVTHIKGHLSVTSGERRAGLGCCLGLVTSGKDCMGLSGHVGHRSPAEAEPGNGRGGTAGV